MISTIPAETDRDYARYAATSNAAPRIMAAKRSFATRRVVLGCATTLISDHKPRPGDLVLARVDSLGSHKSIELPTGRKSALFPGDEILLAYGARYAPDQYEAIAPSDLEPCHMVASGGVAGRALAWHDRLNGPTAITPLGLVADERGAPINLSDFAIDAPIGSAPRTVIAVFGTAMNAGKSTSAAALARGLIRSGARVGSAKLTGTASGGDVWMMRDSGVATALDFTDAGFATTSGADLTALLHGVGRLLATLERAGCEAAVVEVADGLLQREAAALLNANTLRPLFSGVLFAAGDAMGAADGAARVRGSGHRLLGVSGMLSRSPLAIREATEACGAPVYSREELEDPAVAAAIAFRDAVDRAIA